MANTFSNPTRLDWEHKRFFPWRPRRAHWARWARSSPYSRTKRFFNRTLAKIAPRLRANSVLRLYQPQHHRERRGGSGRFSFTCRFDYLGYAILDPLQKTSWADLFRAMLDPLCA